VNKKQFGGSGWVLGHPEPKALRARGKTRWEDIVSLARSAICRPPRCSCSTLSKGQQSYGLEAEESKRGLESQKNALSTTSEGRKRKKMAR